MKLNLKSELSVRTGGTDTCKNLEKGQSSRQQVHNGSNRRLNNLCRQVVSLKQLLNAAFTVFSVKNKQQQHANKTNSVPVKNAAGSLELQSVRVSVVRHLLQVALTPIRNDSSTPQVLNKVIVAY